MGGRPAGNGPGGRRPALELVERKSSEVRRDQCPNQGAGSAKLQLLDGPGRGVTPSTRRMPGGGGGSPLDLRVKVLSISLKSEKRDVVEIRVG